MGQVIHPSLTFYLAEVVTISNLSIYDTVIGLETFEIFYYLKENISLADQVNKRQVKLPTAVTQVLGY